MGWSPSDNDYCPNCGSQNCDASYYYNREVGTGGGSGTNSLSLGTTVLVAIIGLVVVIVSLLYWINA
jgi:uncharacterized membrane protein YvbJ